MLALLWTLACDQQSSNKDSTLPSAEADKDQDGYLEGEDCNDNDPNIHPGATEICDDFDTDENCNGVSDSADSNVQGSETWYPDGDRDGYGDDSAPVIACELFSGTTTPGDCDDQNLSLNPGVHEVCDANQIDEDCDGLINDADDNVTEQQSFFRDSDGDGFGDPAQSQLACTAPDGFVNIAQDCDDADINRRPTQEEIACDGIDQNCDGVDSCTGPANGFYEIDLRQATVVEPASIASQLSTSMTVIGLGVAQADPFLVMTSETLINNQPSCDMPPLVADFSQVPDFTVAPTDVDMNGLIFWSLAASGTFDADYNGFSQGRITGYADVRSAIMGQFGSTPDELCSLLTGFGGSCVTCPGNGDNYCVYMELDHVSGVRTASTSNTTGSLCSNQSSFCATVDANATFALIGLSGVVILKRRRR